MSDSTQQTVAVANALSGDKTFKTIQFAITRNKIADCVAGLEAVLADNGCDHQTQSGVLAMLSLVYERNQKILDERQRYSQMSQLAGTPWGNYPFPSGLGNYSSNGQPP